MELKILPVDTGKKFGKALSPQQHIPNNDVSDTISYTGLPSDKSELILY